MTDDKGFAWWKRGIVYQVYPRSFQDTTGNGIGDLNGIRRRLSHIAGLGVDAIWISPIYPSPMKDGGYDISDYTGIEPIFGTLADFDALVEAVHDQGLKLLLDFVPSHSSDQHPWFLAARSARDDPKREWYIWRDPRADGRPPNNWISEFGGPAWSFDEATGQYYLHIYAREQPALNWRNLEVRAAMYDAMRTWFERGVDGFRVDAAEHLTPDDQLRDNPSRKEWKFEDGPARSLHRTYSSHQPEGLKIVREMRAVAEEYGGRLLVGEAYGELDEVVMYYGTALDGFQLPFNFQLIEAPWDPAYLADYIDIYEAALPDGAWPNWVLGNHDRSRIATRVGAAQARVAAMLLLTLRGTPTIFQGDELGMVNEAIPQEMVQDPWAINNPGTGLGRDPVRVPIPWDDGPNTGFTTGTPWLTLSTTAPVSAQAGDRASMLTFQRGLIALRRSEPALAVGGYERLHADDAVLAYARRRGDRVINVALNFTDRPQPLPCDGTPLLSTLGDFAEGPELRPNEGVVLGG